MWTLVVVVLIVVVEPRNMHLIGEIFLFVVIVVVADPKNLPLKFGQNQIRNS